MSYLVRHATVADISSMHRIRKCVRENRLSRTTAINEGSYHAYIDAGSIWVAECDAEVHGFAAVDYASGSVWALFVDPHKEGTGIGRALQSAMLQHARERGFQRLSLSTEENSRAAGFYRDGGWKRMRVTSDGEAFFEKRLV